MARVDRESGVTEGNLLLEEASTNTFESTRSAHFSSLAKGVSYRAIALQAA